MTKPMQRIVIIFSLFLLVNFSVLANNEQSFQQDLSISVNDIKLLNVDVGSGSLNIQGENVNEITVVALSLIHI